MRRIHKIKTKTVVKEVISDETIELMRDHCTEIRDIAMIDMLYSTGIRVGELVNLNIGDVNLYNVNVSYMEKAIKSDEFISMPKPRYIYKNIWIAGLIIIQLYL